jgi:phosphonate transport system substrate-binding protein
MNRSSAFGLCCACSFLLLLSACSPEASRARVDADAQASAGGQLSLQKLVIALKPDKDPDRMMQERRTLQAFLAEKLGRPVEVIVPLNAGVIMEGFANGTVDLGYLSATEMITSRDQGTASILLAGEINGKTSYQSYWVSLKEKPYASVADLKGRPIAFASKTSTSGYLIPHWDLVKKGFLAPQADPQEFFGRGNVQYGSGYVSAIERVLTGDVEAAAVSYYVLDQDRHLSAEQRDRLKKVTEQGPVPTHVIAVRESISAADKALLKTALLRLNEEKYMDLRDSVFTSKLVEVDQEAHLAALKEALVLTGKARP